MAPSEPSPMAVVKVGGSLLDLPDLAARLGAFLQRLGAFRVVIAPGGGAAANLVRGWDRSHRLGEERSHWLALRAAAWNAWLLETLLPGSRVVRSPEGAAAGVPAILDVFTFACDDEQSPDRLPHSWDVTTDSVAVRAAVVGGARRLFLLKSVELPEGTDWSTAASLGLVDRMFPSLVGAAGVDVEWINLRGRA